MPATQPSSGPDWLDEQAGDLAAKTTVEGGEHSVSSVDWDRLPDPVRLRLAAFAATALPGLAGSDVPRPVRPVVRFAPAKRARLGAPRGCSGNSPRRGEGAADRNRRRCEAERLRGRLREQGIRLRQAVRAVADAETARHAVREAR